jgi:hypothetical protein
MATSMMKRLALTLMAAVLFWIYRTAFIYVVGYATAIHFPAWWLRLMPRNIHGIFAWSFVCHTVAVLLVTLPIAWVLARLYGRLGVYLGAAGALALIAPDILFMARLATPLTQFQWAFYAVDFIKIAVALPLAVWIFLQLPSNSRRGGRESGKVPKLTNHRRAAQAER